MLLNIKSEYNFSKSLCKIDELVVYAKEHNFKTLSMVDNNSLIGSLKFIYECQKENIKPILGIQTQIKINDLLFDILIYAKNTTGYRDLTEYLSLAESYVFTENHLENADLLFIFINCKRNNFSHIEKIISLNPNVYMELTKESADRFIDKSLYVQEARYLKSEDMQKYILLRSLEKKTIFLNEKKKVRENISIEHISKKQVLLDKNLQKNIALFVEKIEEYTFKTDYYKNLEFPMFEKIDFREKLKLKLKSYLENEKNLVSVTYNKRLDLEIEVIEKLGFSKYFLIMEEISKYCSKQDIYYGYGRGSAAGSLVAFLLNITKIDPIKYNLLFERFLNPQRSSLPDIDFDVEDTRRNEVINYLIGKFGEDNVAKIVTINHYQTKSAFNEIAKSLEFPKDSISKISKKLLSSRSFEENINDDYSFFSSYLFDSKFEFLKESMKSIENLPKNISIHAAGIVISSNPLLNFSQISKDGVILNEAKYLDFFGLIKFDILALSNLSFLKELTTKIKTNNSSFDLNEIDQKNSKTFEYLSQGATFNIFQLESRGIRQVLKQYKPQSILDIAIIISLYRPGPMQNIGQYLKNKNNPDGIIYQHEKLKPILKETFGIILFQEQIIEIAKTISGFSGIEADEFRVAVSKKNLKQIKAQEEKFICGGQKQNVKLGVVQEIFNDIEKFANYGFNKAHAVAYARLIYDLAFIKANYSAVFFSTIFKKFASSESKEEMLSELSIFKLSLFAPDILKSSFSNKIKENNILLGFENIKNIEKTKLKELEKVRNKYLKNNKTVTLISLLECILIEIDFSEEEFTNLVSSGAFLCFKTSYKSLIEVGKEYDKLSLEILRISGENLKIVEGSEYNFQTLAALEKKALNFNLTFSIKDILIKKFKEKYNNEILNSENIHLNKQKIYVLGKIIAVKKITTKAGDKMCFLTFSLTNETIDIVVFPEQFKKFSIKLQQDEIRIFLLIKKNSEENKGLMLNHVIY